MFAQRLYHRTLERQTRLCLGLDPRANLYRDPAHLEQHTLEVLETCAPYVACVKPQVAFYEVLGLEGMAILQRICAAAQALELPIILDAKRGDIGSTAQAYAQAWLTGQYAGCAVTVNPFLGFETLTPFVETARANGGGVFVLVKTSNAGSRDIQDLRDADLPQITVAHHIALELARLAQEERGQEQENPSGLSSVGAVVGATHPTELRQFRNQMPAATLLLPGLGAQGADPRMLAAAFLPGGVGAVVSASRGIQYANGLDVAAALEATRGFQDQLNNVVNLLD
jgi:orotidine-5'-phosphate decarboxylase